MAQQVEHREQVATVAWFRFQYPQGLIYAIPNSARRSPRQGAWMKAEGLSAGVPDLCIPMPRGKYHGLYIEMKAGKNKPTPAQVDWMNKLIEQGYCCKVCYGYEDGVREIKEYMSLLT